MRIKFHLQWNLVFSKGVWQKLEDLIFSEGVWQKLEDLIFSNGYDRNKKIPYYRMCLIDSRKSHIFRRCLTETRRLHILKWCLTESRISSTLHLWTLIIQLGRNSRFNIRILLVVQFMLTHSLKYRKLIKKQVINKMAVAWIMNFGLLVGSGTFVSRSNTYLLFSSDYTISPGNWEAFYRLRKSYHENEINLYPFPRLKLRKTLLLLR